MPPAIARLPLKEGAEEAAYSTFSSVPLPKVFDRDLPVTLIWLVV
jgi:hypothetical protein